MAARWALLAVVVGGLFLAAVVVGLRVLQGVYVADERERVELVRSEGSWTPVPQPGIHYAPAVVVDLDHEGVGRG